jgi:1-acyl-sn-glycerol-3-phosphate acyltransferase
VGGAAAALNRPIDFQRLAAPPPRWDDALFWTFHATFGGLVRRWVRLCVEGAPPADGGFVLAANHSSLFDPILLGTAIRRRIVYLMTESLWRSPGLGWFYRWNRAIPLSSRGGNREPLRAARQVLQQHRVVGIFLEGGLSRDGLLMLGNPGAVSLVLNEGLPIVPVGILGAADVLPPGARLPRFRRVTIRFGEPMQPADFDRLGSDRRTRLKDATATIMRRIASLTDQVAREDALAGARSSADSG